MNKNSVRKFLGRPAFALSAGLALSAINGAQAQTPTPPPNQATGTGSAATSDDQAVQLQQYVVTGSYIPMSSVAPAIPVTTLDTQQIVDSGEHMNLLDVLTKVSPVFTGGLNLGPSNGNVASNSTNGGSEAEIRDLPTLVLINGQRITFDPVNAVGGLQFVDLNIIPVSAVDKIEVLTDGASAIYGSDAVGGVVNVILKKDYNGWDVGGSYEFAPDLQSGHWTERDFYLTGGISDGKNSILISAEWMKSDPLYQYQASTSAFTVGTTNYPGVINLGTAYYKLNPSLTTPPTTANGSSIASLVASGVYSGPYNSSQIIDAFNLSEKATTYIGDQRKSLVADFTHVFSDNLTFSGFVVYSDTNTFSQLNAQPVAEVIAAGAPFNPLNVAVEAHNRFVTYPRQYITDTPTISGNAEMDGKIGANWSWSLNSDYSVANQHFQNPNLIEASALENDEAAGTINLFANTTSPAQVAALGIFGSAFGEYSTSLTTDQAVLKGNIFTEPAGDVQAAFGVQYRREAYSATADINSLSSTFNWASGTVISPLTVARNIWGEFAQVVIPIVSPSMGVPGIYSLTTDDAVRHEVYAQTPKKPTDPLLTLRWQPFDEQFTIRGSYTQSFIAPTLFDLFGPSSEGFTPDLTNFQQYGGGAIANDGQAQAESLSNTSLAPTTAETFTLGFVYSPKQIKGLSVTTDYGRVRENNVIGVPDTQPILQSVENLGAASPYTKPTTISGDYLPLGQVTLNDFGDEPDAVAITKPGQVAGDTSNVFVVTNSGNVPGTKLEFIDDDINYSWDTSIGRWTIDSKQTYFLHYWTYAFGVPPSQIAGQATPSLNTFGGSIPRWRAYTNADYRIRGWIASLAMTYIPALVDGDDGQHINAYYSWDSRFGYRFTGEESNFTRCLKGLEVDVGVNDMFNRQPSPDFDTFAQDNTDISLYSPLGRVVYFDVDYKF